MTQVTLANTRPSEVRLSADGSKLYSADRDGYLRVYSAQDGTLQNAWQIGQKLGGMDISPDGSFLVVVERNLSVTYRVDTATGAKTTFPYATSGYDGLLFDVAVLSNGTALFSQDFNGSGWTALKVLNFTTGIYTAGPSVRQSSALSRSPTGDKVLVGEPNISNAQLDIYTTGTGLTAFANAGGFNWGIQAFSGALATHYIYNEGIHVYNAALQRQITLTAWNYGAVTDLAFSPDSAFLYVLDNVANTVVKISTADWSTVSVVQVGADVGGWMGQVGATNGDRLIVDKLGRYISVVTDGALVLVENTAAPDLNGTANGEMIEGALFGDRIFGFGGNDLLYGYAGNDTLDGGAGSDVVHGGAGNDVITADLSDIVLDGGAGNDRLIFVDSGAPAAALSGMEIFDLNGAALSLSATQFTNGLAFNGQVTGTGSVAITIDQPNQILFATSVSIAAGIAFTITGSSGTDLIKAGHAMNTINGGDGSDFLKGGNLADTINGGNDGDKILGWGGADTLTGGAGADKFRYIFATDSGLGAAADKITDFVAGPDQLDFRFLDSDLVTPDVQPYALSFIGTAAFGGTGSSQIRYGVTGADLTVELDLDGDGAADMQIVLQGNGAGTLGSGDFLL